MKHWGIRARVLFLALAPSVMILFTLVAYFTYQGIREVDISLSERGKLVARRLSVGTEFAIFAGDRAALQRLTDAALREADVSSITVHDGQGSELARSDAPIRSQADTLLSFVEPVIQTRLAAGDFPEQAQSSGAPAKVGEIAVVMSRETAVAQQQRLLFSGLALGLAGLIVAITLGLLIGNAVIRPIRRLANAMVELGHGRHVLPISTSGGGELTTLAEGFNRMAARLQADARELEMRINAATHELMVQKDTAEQATQAKSRFVAAASHDLRQPLHAIGLFTSSLQRRTAGTELQPLVADLATAVASMDRLFNSLLDISRLDSGALQVESRPFPLDRLFAQIAAENHDAALQKQLHLRVRCTGAVVASDELLLHRILTNLLANAIRYTHTGSVMLACRYRGNRVQVEVRDSGIGIAPEKHDDIFLEFYQIGDAQNEQHVSLGLGLAIVSRLARLLGTRVVVQSSPGRGSVFSLCLPRGEPEASTTVDDAAPTGYALSGPALQVLVVDDDPLVLAGNRALLEEFGCEVRTTANGHGALAALAGYGDRAVLVLCDMWLGNDENGIDLLRKMDNLTTARVSGILISGDTGPKTQMAAIEAGYPLLHKPVAPARLRAVVMNFAWKLRELTASGPHDEDSAR